MFFLTAFCQISAALAAPKGFAISLPAPFTEIFFIFEVGDICLALSCKKWVTDVAAGAGLRSAQLSKPVMLEPDGRLFF